MIIFGVVVVVVVMIRSRLELVRSGAMRVLRFIDGLLCGTVVPRLVGVLSI